MPHTNNKEVAKAVERIADKVNEYARQHYLVSEESHPVADEMKAWDDLIDTLHQELQKAREEMLHKLHLCAIGKYEGDALENVKAQIKEYQSELDQPIS